MSFRIISFGEALWDLLPDEKVLGGAPLNFAYRIGTLGTESVLVSRVGLDDLGKNALSRMRNLGMDVSLIQEDPRKPTGTVHVRFDEHRNPDYVIVEDVAYDYIQWNDPLREKTFDADCVCFGSLAQRNEISKAALAKLLGEFRGTYKLYDINLRKKCYTADIIRSSLGAADIVKLNETELVELKTLLSLSSRGMGSLAFELADTYGIAILVVTLGDKGAFAAAGGSLEYACGFSVSVEDTLGSGDAFTAGFMYALLAEKPVSEALETGNALGAIVAGQKGATQDTSLDELAQFMRSGKRGPAHPEFS